MLLHRQAPAPAPLRLVVAPPGAYAGAPLRHPTLGADSTHVWNEMCRFLMRLVPVLSQPYVCGGSMGVGEG
ncbi:MAG: hypothetical protein MI924_18075 [Chloroflexales bacterium]|nr:hypothetical protein [Chloroflexales bacterium]